MAATDGHSWEDRGLWGGWPPVHCLHELLLSKSVGLQLTPGPVCGTGTRIRTRGADVLQTPPSNWHRP